MFKDYFKYILKAVLVTTFSIENLPVAKICSSLVSELGKENVESDHSKICHDCPEPVIFRPVVVPHTPHIKVVTEDHISSHELLLLMIINGLQNTL